MALSCEGETVIKMADFTEKLEGKELRTRGHGLFETDHRYTSAKLLQSFHPHEKKSFVSFDSASLYLVPASLTLNACAVDESVMKLKLLLLTVHLVFSVFFNNYS